MNEIDKEYLYQEVDKLIDKKMFGDLTTGETMQLDYDQQQIAILEQQERDKVEAGRLVRRKRAKKVNKQFKRDEDWLCEQLGLKREGHMKRGISCADGVNEMFSYDATRTTKKLSYLRGELADAKAHATQCRTPVVVIFQNDYERKHAMVLLDFSHWVDLHG